MYERQTIYIKLFTDLQKATSWDSSKGNSMEVIMKYKNEILLSS